MHSSGLGTLAVDNRSYLLDRKWLSSGGEPVHYRGGTTPLYGGNYFPTSREVVLLVVAMIQWSALRISLDIVSNLSGPLLES